MRPKRNPGVAWRPEEEMEEDVEEFLRDLGQTGRVILDTPGDPRGPRWKIS